MVKSGLNDTDVRVDHMRLAVHFSCALLLLGYLFWITLKVSIHPKRMVRMDCSKRLLPVILVLVGIQLIYGAFMAGTHAALSAPTWPDINGTDFPANLLTGKQVLYRAYHDPILIQFIHRMLAYLIVLLVMIRSFLTRVVNMRWTPLGLVGVQVFLGVLTLTHSIFTADFYLAVLHQFVGILLLLSLLAAFFLQKG